MGLPRNKRSRRALEERVRVACLAIACPDHGQRPADILFTWNDNKLAIEVRPLPCCKTHDDALCEAFTRAIGGKPAN